MSIVIFIIGISIEAWANETNNPCDGPSALLNIIDRPTVGDSACVVPVNKAVVELGYQYQKNYYKGYLQNFPEAEFRLGMPANNEIVFLIPSYIEQSIIPHSGYGVTSVGVKHQIGYNSQWVLAAEILLTPPSGSSAFGNRGVGMALNGIGSFNFNPTFNMTFMLGGTTQTQPRSVADGRHFISLNPDLVLTYSLTPTFEVYGEIYGQTKTASRQGSGFNFDTGIIYLLLPFITVDMEYCQRINGFLNDFNHYIGMGMAVEL